MSVETDQNYAKFSQSLPAALEKNVKALRGRDQLVQNYSRVAAMNAVKMDLFLPLKSADAASFFAEAHNDALISHVSASFGSWRTALQALRSFLENTFSAIYFMDHPVELEKWKDKKFYISPKDLREYISEHPALVAYTSKDDFRSSLTEEYATLSKAVHGSSPLFRMSTGDGATNFGTASVADLGKWSTRERAAFNLCTIAIVGVFHQYLDGTKLPVLRSALSQCVTEKSKKAIRDSYGINLVPS